MGGGWKVNPAVRSGWPCGEGGRGRGWAQIVNGPLQEGESVPASGGSWWRRWVVAPVLAQLKQGTSATKLAWTMATGVTLGLFPIPGTRGGLCLMAGIAFRLNQPLLHTFKGLVFPLHLFLLIPFIQMGQGLFGKEPLPLDAGGLERLMADGTWAFLKESAGMLLRAAVVWLGFAPVVLLGSYAICSLLIRKFLGRMGKMKAKDSGPG